MRKRNFGEWIVAILYCLLPLIAALACQLFISIVGIIFTGLVMTPDETLIITAIATFVTAVLSTVWYILSKRNNDLKVKELFSWKFVGCILAMGIGLQFAITAVLEYVFMVLPQSYVEKYNELMSTITGTSLTWLSVVTTVILAPIAEETIYRGLTFKIAKKYMPFLWANFIQALFFGIYHMNLIQGAYAFAFGLILGMTAEYFNSIYASMALHAVINAAAYLIEVFEKCEFDFLIPLLGIIGLGLAFLGYCIMKKINVRNVEPKNVIENNAAVEKTEEVK